ncbi:P-loop containing nucleoside triphosphate hydrolase protein, partial [Dimargaris cristalligena]
SRTISWFPGHMARAMREIAERLQKIDLIIETRDARIPLSSINPHLEQLVQSKDRLIVYNKVDLAAPQTPAETLAALRRMPGQNVEFTSLLTNSDPKRILKHIVEKARQRPAHSPPITAMVIGMPNVGKSYLINALRRVGLRGGRGTKAASTGARAGVTRRVSNIITVHRDPVVYLSDTPGVMMPYIADPLHALRVALTGGINEDVVDPEIMADYLLFILNRTNNTSYKDEYRLDQCTDDITELLPQVAQTIGAIGRGGEPRFNEAARNFIKRYQKGKFGRITLDPL